MDTRRSGAGGWAPQMQEEGQKGRLLGPLPTPIPGHVDMHVRTVRLTLPLLSWAPSIVRTPAARSPPFTEEPPGLGMTPTTKPGQELRGLEE